MGLSLWPLLTLLGKILLYASVASAIGGLFTSQLLARHRDAATAIARYTRCGCMVGIFVVVFNLLVQVGALADRGLAGAFDTTMMPIIVQTSVGQALQLQVIGFSLVGLCTWWSLRGTATPQAMSSNLISVIGCLVLVVSFFQVGHFAEAAWGGKLAIALHILAVSMWIGSLYPLWIISRTADVPAMQVSMEIFSRIAVFIVGVLVVCGVVMSILLVKDLHTLLSSGYGRGLLFKMVLVGALLLLAASNKWLIVPHLNQAGFRQRLSRAIVLEMLVAGLILCVTGVITAVIGID